MTVTHPQPLRLMRLIQARPVLSPAGLMMGTAAFLLAFYNPTFWNKGLTLFAEHPGQLAILMVAVFFLTVSVMALFGSRWTLQPFLAFLLILSSVTSFYVENLGAVIDRDMVQNAVTTTYNESKHLVTPRFALQVLVWGIVPSLVVFRVRLRPGGFWRALLRNAVLFTVSFALCVGLLLTNYKSYASIFRERKDFMGSYQPGAPLVSAIRYVELTQRATNITVAVVGGDAKKGAALASATKPVLTLLVVGETARSQNFSLNGYDRDTNRFLAEKPIVNYTDVASCGTATAVSMPCMFSKFDRGTYSYTKGVSNENLLDVLKHAGVRVEWWDNNTGHKKIADRVEYRPLFASKDPEFCAKGECIDGIFLSRLREYAENMTEDTVLVLHLIGSHGPTYYLRYPPEFEAFTPACRSADFQKCTAAQITNSYDNTILYTDFILAQMIDFLSAQTDLLTALVYVSDHGESLGEGGLYLHGAPYMFAPETQTKVPMIVWLAQSFQKQLGIDQTCLESESGQAISHANLFHSILGLMDIQVSERRDGLDIFADCKTTKTAYGG